MDLYLQIRTHLDIQAQTRARIPTHTLEYTKLFNAENVVEQKTQKFIFLSILRKIAIEFWEESFLFLSLQNENENFYSHYLVAAIVVGTHGLKKATKRLRVGANISFEKSN